MSQLSFKPAWWLPGPHLQTLWPTFSRRGKKQLHLKRERIELADGDFIDLDWTHQTTGPIVLILHGLEGSSESPYAKGMLQAISQKGWRAVLMYFRGCSGEHNRLQRMYHCGETGDLSTIVRRLKSREPNTPIVAMGFSVGGNILLKWLGESGQENPLTAAVAVSVPFDLSKAVDRLHRGFSRLYEHHLLKSMCQKVATKFDAQSRPAHFPPVMSLKTIREFDDKVVAPLHGFSGAADYYKKSSSRQFLKTIQVPTLILHAKDDPFMTADVIPGSQELSKYVTLETTQKGGHVGFVTGVYPWRPQYWLEHRIPLFLQEYFS